MKDTFFFFFFFFFLLINKSSGVNGPCIYDSNPKGVIDLTRVGNKDGTARWKYMDPEVSDDHS